jgi:hypothetical protein
VSGVHEQAAGAPARRAQRLGAAFDRVLVPLPEVVTARLGKIVLWGWVAVLLSVILFEPASNPDVAIPWWGDVMGASFWLALLAGGVTAAKRLRTAALSLSAAAGILGVGMAVACTVTDHHTGFFPTYELISAGVLASLSVAGLRSGGARR